MGDYTVSSARRWIGKNTLVVDDSPTKWNNLVPIKVNILTWKIKLDKVSADANLDKQGIDLDSILCLICDTIIETANHIFLLSCLL